MEIEISKFSSIPGTAQKSYLNAQSKGVSVPLPHSEIQQMQTLQLSLVPEKGAG